MNGSHLARRIVAQAAAMRMSEPTPADSMVVPHQHLPAMLTMERLAASHTTSGTEWLLSNSDC